MTEIAVCACGRVYRAAPAPAGWRCHWCALGQTGPGLVVVQAPPAPPVYRQEVIPL